VDFRVAIWSAILHGVSERFQQAITTESMFDGFKKLA
jgi:hypothetical protein